MIFGAIIIISILPSWPFGKASKFNHLFVISTGYGWYKYRWNDLVFQSAALQVFMPKEKIYKFTDWTYEHATIRDGRLDFGGIFEGSADQSSEAVAQFRARLGTTDFPPGRFR